MMLHSYEAQEGFLFWLAESALLAGGVVGGLAAMIVSKSAGRVVRRWLLGAVAVFACALVITLSKWSFKGMLADSVFLAVGYAAVPFLSAVAFLRVKRWWLKALALSAWILVTVAGLLISTVGLLGVGFALMDLPIQVEFPAGPGYVCRQQLFGDAIHLDGVKVTIQRTPWFLSGTEKEVYSWRHVNESGENWGDTLVTEASIDAAAHGLTLVHFKTRTGEVLVDTLQ